MSKNDTPVSTTMKALEVETPVTETKNPMVSDSSDDEEGDNQMVSDPRQGFLDSLSFCKLLGCRGAAYMILLLIVGALHFILFFIVTHNGVQPFARVSREFAWIFLLFACLFLLALIRALLPKYWRNLAQRVYDNSQGNRKSARPKRPTNAIVRLHRAYQDNFNLNGKFYLWRLHLFEFMENYVSVYNMRTIYLCSLPHYVCMILMAFLIAESLYRAHSMAGYLWRREAVSKKKRDLQITLDIVVDMVFLILPFVVAEIYLVTLSIHEIIAIVTLPSLSLLSKLRKMVQEAIEDRADQIVTSVLMRRSQTHERRRQSMFGNSRREQVEATQEKYFPRWAKLGVFSLSVIYVCVLLLIGVVQLVTVSQVKDTCDCFVDPACESAAERFENASSLRPTTNASNGIFSTGCRVKAPFCANLLVPACNCAVFEVNDHNLERLSDKFVELTALRKVTLTSGPLEELPNKMEKLNQITLFDISFNQVQTFNVDVGKWGKLVTLMIRFNNITSVHPSVWKHKTLIALEANSNLGLHIPDGTEKLFLPSLFVLDMTNNSCLLPSSLGPSELPQIGSLTVDGNQLRDGCFPSGFENFFDTVQTLGISHLGVTALPKFITTFHALRYLDARNNILSNISSAFESYIAMQQKSSAGFAIYLSGNPGCSSHPESLPSCKPLCSEYCQSESYLEDGECDAGCNSQDCNLDGGDCK